MLCVPCFGGAPPVRPYHLREAGPWQVLNFSARGVLSTPVWRERGNVFPPPASRGKGEAQKRVLQVLRARNNGSREPQ